MAATSSPLHIADQLKPMLRSLRKKRGLTQAQLGQLLGVSQARVAEIEANPGVVGIAAMLKVLSTLGAGLQLQVHDSFGSGLMAPMRGQAPTQNDPKPGTTLARKPKRGTW
ncbi:transcriptional regulator, y4mF family [compost metagenome]|uniref:helix-turn-helix domain-containing protein n=1 Tax=Hydrogenophaga sp. Root209 TaxID=1736490 RepID=UPI0009EAC67D|nr:helix-turn-helix domain-containing protein [Hydrogenophaga sp. Root209]